MNLLFFSDAHFRRDSNYVREEVFQHITAYCRTNKPDLILFTGDLTNTGGADEYMRAVASWRRLKDACPNAEIAWAPGNHDLKRTPCPIVERYLTGPLNAAEIEELLDIDSKNEELSRSRGMLTARFANWKNAATELEVLAVQHLVDNGMQCGSAIINIGCRRVAVSVVNSAFTAFGDNDHEKLLVSRKLSGDLVAAAQGADIRIMLTHHPRSWWHSRCRDTWGLLEQGHDFVLTGHEHQGMIGQTAATVDLDVHCHFLAAGACDIEHGGGTNQLFRLEFTDKDDGGTAYRGQRLNASIEGTGGIHPFPSPITNSEGWYPKSGDLSVGRKNSTGVSRDGAGEGWILSESMAPPLDLRAFLRWIETNFGVEVAVLHHSTVSASPRILYWPVRLRAPNLVHAVQTFIAAALSSRGVPVYLCFDDLGKLDGYSSTRIAEDAFIRKALAWAQKVVSPQIAAELFNGRRLFSDYVGDNESGKEARDGVLQSLGRNLLGWLVAKDHLKAVLHESKLMKSETEVDFGGRPRRLLTPPLVWTVLQTLQKEHPDTTILTLGGVDERPIWSAFETVNTPGSFEFRVGYAA